MTPRRHGLLMKLYATGMRGYLLIYVNNFILDRTFSVKLFSETVTLGHLCPGVLDLIGECSVYEPNFV